MMQTFTEDELASLFLFADRAHKERSGLQENIALFNGMIIAAYYKEYCSGFRALLDWVAATGWHAGPAGIETKYNNFFLNPDLVLSLREKGHTLLYEQDNRALQSVLQYLEEDDEDRAFAALACLDESDKETAENSSSSHQIPHSGYSVDGRAADILGATSKIVEALNKQDCKLDYLEVLTETSHKETTDLLEHQTVLMEALLEKTERIEYKLTKEVETLGLKVDSLTTQLGALLSKVEESLSRPAPEPTPTWDYSEDPFADFDLPEDDMMDYKHEDA